MLRQIEHINEIRLYAVISGSYFFTSNGDDVGITEQNYRPLKISPNEANDIVTICLPDELTQSVHSVRIIDIAGNQVDALSTGTSINQDISIGVLPAGKYFIIVGNYLGQFIKK